MILSNETLDDALRTTFDFVAGDGLTIRQWFIELARKAWIEGEEFDGRYAWGNPGWEDEVYQPLYLGGFIDGYELTSDRDTAKAFVEALLNRMAETPQAVIDPTPTRNGIPSRHVIEVQATTRNGQTNTNVILDRDAMGSTIDDIISFLPPWLHEDLHNTWGDLEDLADNPEDMASVRGYIEEIVNYIVMIYASAAYVQAEQAGSDS